MAVIVVCADCGCEVEIHDERLLIECPACGRQNRRPAMTEETLGNFKNAIRLRNTEQFGRALKAYELMLNAAPDNVEALWGCLLCRYGARCEVVKKQRYWIICSAEPDTAMISTHPDFQHILSLLEDSPELRQQYTDDAAYIDEAIERIQGHRAEGLQYDIFLCHKTTKEDGSKTPEYYQAADLYDELIRRKYRVFFAPREIYRAAGADYEAAIYAALYSAKVMIVVCQNEEYLTSRWVYGEWKRFMNRMRSQPMVNGHQLRLIPLMMPPMTNESLPMEFKLLKLQGILLDFKGRGLEELYEVLKPYKAKKEKSWRPIIALAIAVVVIAGAAAVMLGGSKKDAPPAPTASPTAAVVTATPAVTQYRVKRGDADDDAQRAIRALKRLYYLDEAGEYTTFDTDCATAFMKYCEDNGLPVEMDVSNEAFESLTSYDARPMVTPMIQTQLGSAVLNGSGSTCEIAVKSNGDWRVATTYDWITLDRNGGTGDGAVQVTLAVNPSTTQARTGYVTFIRGTLEPVIVEITQSRRDYVAVSATGEGAERQVAVEANGAWTAATDDDWIKLNTSSGTGNATVSVSLAANPSTQEDRTGYVTFTCGTEEQTVAITQPRADSIGASVTGEGLTREVAVISNGAWTAEAESGADWIVLDNATGTGDASVTVTLTENPSTQAERTGTITFTCGTASTTVTITQARRDSITASPAEGGVAVMANGDWTARAEVDWITLQKNSGTGSGTVSFTLADNPSTTEDRTGVITFTCGTATASVDITQPRADSIRVTPSGEGLTRGIAVEANGAWTAAVADADWIVLKESRGTGNASVTVTLTENPSLTEGRSGKITFTCGTASASVTISQGKQDSISVAASAEGPASASGVVRNVTVTANGAWTAEVGAPWLTLEPAAGEAGATQGTLTITANTSTEQGRSAVIIFRCGAATQEMTVAQNMQDAISVDATDVSISADKAIHTAAVTANGAWSASSEEDWITLNPAAGQGNGTLIAVVKPNESTTADREGSIVLRCGTAQQTVTIRQARADAITLKHSVDSMIPAAQASHTLSVEANGPWTAQTGADWLSLSRKEGSGNAALILDVAANASTSANRTGTVLFTCGQASYTLTVTQARQDSLKVALEETLTCSASGERRAASLKANGAWKAEVSDDWIELNKTEGTGDVTFAVTVKPNESTTSDRSGTITFTCGTANQTVTIIQNKRDAIAVKTSQDTMAAAGGSCILTVEANGPWTAEGSDWLTLSAVKGSGNATITLDAAAYASTDSDRVGMITFTCGAASQTVTITQYKQDSLSVSLDETISCGAPGGKYTGMLKANGDWTVAASDDWIVPAKKDGEGNSAITITVTANESTTEGRTGFVTFTCGTASQTVTITQEKKDSLSIDADIQQTLKPGGGDITVPVAANGAWTVSSGARWITLNNASGSGDGIVTVTVAANESTTADRTGVVTFECGDAKQTMTITQPKMDAVKASLAGSAELGSGAAQRSIAVNANGTWTAQTDTSWISVEPATGNGVGRVQIRVGANESTTEERTGVITFNCGEAVDTVTITQAKQESLSATLSSGSVGAGEEQTTVRVTANGAWTATTRADWLTLSARSGTGDADVTVTAKPNASITDERSATVTFTCGTVSQTVTITQAKKDNIIVGGANDAFVAAGASHTYTVAANGPWTAAPQEDWITLDRASGDGNDPVIVTVQPNASTEAGRTGMVVFTCGTATYELTISQVMQDSIAVSEGEFTFGADGVQTEVTVTANGDWTAEPDADWIEVKRPLFGGDTTLKVTVKPNESIVDTRTGTITLTCGTVTSTVTITQQKKDSIVVKGDFAVLDAADGSRVYTITANGAWTVEDDADWISVRPASGDGSASVTVTIQPYEGTDKNRAGHITFTCGTASQSVTITQRKADSLTVAEKETTIDAASGVYSIVLKANGAWSAQTDADWLTLNTPRGNGDGTLRVAFKANTSTTAPRTGTITITCGTVTRTVTITQRMKDSITVAGVNRTVAANAGTQTYTVRANGPWMATSDVKWLEVIPGAGSGDANVTVTLQPNESTDRNRVGKITFTCGTAEQTVSVTQQRADSITVSAGSAHASATGENRTITVEANGEWTVKSSAAWLKVNKTSGKDGTTKALLTIEKNTSTTQSRTGAITFTCGEASQIVTITQAKQDSITVSAGSAHAVAAGEDHTITVEANGDWTAKSSAAWLKVNKTSGKDGTTKALLTIEKNASTTQSREGTITFTCGEASQTVTITQAKADHIEVDTSSAQPVPAGGATRRYTVKANGRWTAEVNGNWLTLSQDSGDGDATIDVVVSANPYTTGPRTGKITFKCGTASYTVEIEQNKADRITATATESGAVAAAGGSRTFTVTATGKWTAQSSVKWIELSRDSGDGNGSVTATLQANPSTATTRQGKITFICGEASVDVTITQARADEVKVETPGDEIVPPEGSRYTFKVSANGNWKATTSDNWITFNPRSGSAHSVTQMTVDVKANTGDTDRVGAITFTCGTASQTVTIMQAKADHIAVTYAGNDTEYIPGSGGTRTYTIDANGMWTAKTNHSWIELGRKNGNGDGTLTVNVKENTGASERTGSITFTCGSDYTTVFIRQRVPDSIKVTGDRIGDIAAKGETCTYTVRANGAWEARASDSWITLDTTSGYGSGVVKATMSVNGSNVADRTGTITFTCGTATETVIITQLKKDVLIVDSTSMMQADEEGEDRTYTIKANGAWKAETTVNWITLSKNSGTGDGSVRVTIAPNKGTSERTGTIKFSCGVLSTTITIRQGKMDVLTVTSSSSRVVPNEGEKRTYAVKANGAWKATTSGGWITLSPKSGNGDATVTATVSANAGTENREATITFTCGKAEQTVKITQAKADSIKVTAGSTKEISGSGDTRSYSVVSSGKWTAQASHSWITLNTKSGSGNGTVKATIAANPSTTAPRTGTITFTCGTASTTVTITQAKASPFNKVMSKPQKARLGRQNSAYVYSGPGTNYYRAANGKAECTVYEDFYVWGYENGWYMITYETNGGANRTGYIRQGSQKGDFTGKLSTSPLEFASKAARTTSKVNLTDDPDGMRTTIFTLNSGTSVTYLGSYSNSGRDWYYIECMVSGKKTRGFIPAGTLEIK